MKSLIKITCFAVCALFFLSCGKEPKLTADYQAPSELPGYLVPGTALNDSILQLYHDLGVVIYTHPDDPRFVADMVSSESLDIADRQPADTAAALLYIRMIRDEFYKELPDDKKYLVPRNYYFMKNLLISGSGYSQYFYLAKVWYNSSSDVTVGGLDDSNTDTTMLKQSLYYALSGILRQQPDNGQYYTDFQLLKQDAGYYYWQVYTMEDAYNYGFLSADQTQISTDIADFDLFAAWGATVKPEVRDSLLSLYPLLASKYNIVASMFRSAGIPLETITEDWQKSPLNPDHD